MRQLYSQGSALQIDQALSALQNPNPKARVHAIRWLRVRGGPRAVDALIGALDDPDHDVHRKT